MKKHDYKIMSKDGMKHDHHSGHAKMIKDFKKRFIVSSLLTIPIILFSPFIQNIFGYKIVFEYRNLVLLIFSTIVYVYGGKPFLIGMRNEIKERKLGMMTLVALAITVAYVYSIAVTFGISGKTFYWELATLIDIMLLGHFIEMRSLLGASKALEKLVGLMPTEAHIITSKGIVDIPVTDLKKGDIVLVKPGEKIPTDGIVVEGETSVDESMLTGESKPIYKKPGDIVIGGSINIEGSINVRVEKTGEETYLMQVIQIVKRAQESKSKTQDLANRAAFLLTIIAIITGTITFISWFFAERDVVFALERMITVMVITCPHALGLAIPLVVSVSTSLSANNGILIRNRDAFEKARKIQTIVFDKTGTLTEGKFTVTDIIRLNEMNEMEILSYVASLESNSQHPIAEGIVKEAKKKNIKLYEVKDFKIIPGKGVYGRIFNKDVYIVSPVFLKEKNLWKNDDRIERVMEQGKTLAFLIIGNKLVGCIALADTIREEAKYIINRLRKMNIKVYMLTGDNLKTAKWVADELKLDGYFAEILPHQKLEKIRELQKNGDIVAMIGDGVNDAPALIQADIGIAIGAGTDIAIESADIILVKNDLRDVIAIISLAKATYSKMLQNLGWAIGYNSFSIPLAAGVLYNYGILLSPAIGAILMSLSTIIVAVNALILKYRFKLE